MDTTCGDGGLPSEILLSTRRFQEKCVGEGSSLRAADFRCVEQRTRLTVDSKTLRLPHKFKAKSMHVQSQHHKKSRSQPDHP